MIESDRQIDDVLAGGVETVRLEHRSTFVGIGCYVLPLMSVLFAGAALVLAFDLRELSQAWLPAFFGVCAIASGWMAREYWRNSRPIPILVTRSTLTVGVGSVPIGADMTVSIERMGPRKARLPHVVLRDRDSKIVVALTCDGFENRDAMQRFVAAIQRGGVLERQPEV